MSKEVKKKPGASIGVDVDTLGSYYQAYGIAGKPAEDPVYSRGVPRYLELFRELEIRATFFLVARDLDHPAQLEIARRIRDEGHEIGSHSLTHPFRFRSLPRPEKERQIREAEEKMENLLGVRPRGFRVPGWDVDEETLSILESRGYLYDSSVLPSLILPLLKLVHLLKGGAKRGTTGMGKNLCALAPSRPYFPSRKSIWRRGGHSLLEIPISVTPLIRLPFFASWHLALNFFIYPWDYYLLRWLNVPINYELHPIEMIDYSEGDYPPAIKAQPGFATPWRKKRQGIGDLLRRVKSDYRIVTFREQAELEINGNRECADEMAL